MAFKNGLSDANGHLRELKHDVDNLRRVVYDSMAVTQNLPHKDLTKYIPFRSDEDLCTVLDNADLNNALFSKVSRCTSSCISIRTVITYLYKGHRAPR